IVLIGDASGHGLKACMSIMAMHTLVRMIHGDLYRNTASFVTEINRRLCENSIVQSDGGFITLFYAAVDTVDHTMTSTSAGPPVAPLQALRHSEIVQVGRGADGGLPLAVAPGVEYESCTLPLPKECRVLLYSDGLTDAFPQGQSGFRAFGVPGLREALRASRDVPLDQALEQLFQASNQFTGGSGRHDDTSVVLLGRGDGETT